jgi:hypothetical protein
MQLVTEVTRRASFFRPAAGLVRVLSRLRGFFCAGYDCHEPFGGQQRLLLGDGRSASVDQPSVGRLGIE